MYSNTKHPPAKKVKLIKTKQKICENISYILPTHYIAIKNAVCLLHKKSTSLSIQASSENTSLVFTQQKKELQAE